MNARSDTAAPGAADGARGKGHAGQLAGALDSAAERLSNCVHCGFCLPACPTYARLGDEADSPRGRLYLMRAVVEGRLDPASDAFQVHIDRCLGCRACEPVCPSGVEYGHLLERARDVAASARPRSPSTRLLLSVMGNARAEAAFMAFSRLLRGTGIPALLSRRLPGSNLFRRMRLAMGMLAASAPFRWPDGSQRRVPSPPDPGGAAPEAHVDQGVAREGRGTVAVLTGCVQEGLFARVNRATVRVLRANGYEVVEAPGQVCCGALHAHGGSLERARELARSNIEAFETVGADFVVVNAAGCGSTMKDYGELFGEDAEWFSRGRELAERVRDVSELLAGAGPRRGAPVPLRLAYDPPCHLLHAQRIDQPALRVLDAVPGLDRVPLANAEECCGGAGIYGITHPDLGGAIGSDKVRAVIDSGAQAVATGNPGCMMQIGAGLRMAGVGVGVLHPVEILDESYHRARVYDGGPASSE